MKLHTVKFPPSSKMLNNVFCFVEKLKLLNVEIWGEQIEQFEVVCGLWWKDRVDYELI